MTRYCENHSGLPLNYDGTCVYCEKTKKEMRESMAKQSEKKSEPLGNHAPEKPRLPQEKDYKYVVIGMLEKFSSYPEFLARPFENFEEAKQDAAKIGGRLFGLSPEYEISVIATVKPTGTTITTTSTPGYSIYYPCADPCDHVWIYNYGNTVGDHYTCSKCHIMKTEAPNL
jgi:hypothetical protein